MLVQGKGIKNYRVCLADHRSLRHPDDLAVLVHGRGFDSRRQHPLQRVVVLRAEDAPAGGGRGDGPASCRRTERLPKSRSHRMISAN